MGKGRKREEGGDRGKGAREGERERGGGGGEGRQSPSIP